MAYGKRNRFCLFLSFSDIYLFKNPWTSPLYTFFEVQAKSNNGIFSRKNCTPPVEDINFFKVDPLDFQ